MIGRIWVGRTRAAHADAYYQYLLATGLNDYAATAGNRCVHVLRRVDGDVAEFTLLTFWDAWDDIRRFAGPNPEVAVYYPDDDEYLLEKNPRVTHYEVLSSQ
ncbi:MAG: antibiotic biosynthesis monooxygenase [Chloroflexota bacterium]|nr:antibiotic biosynthesis monooxygenase [Chloroflexota bacterium]